MDYLEVYGEDKGQLHDYLCPLAAQDFNSVQILVQVVLASSFAESRMTNYSCS